MKDEFKRLAAIWALFYSQNDIALVHNEEANESQSDLAEFSMTAGLQADLLDSDVSTPIIENVGDPREVFVHAGSLADLLDVSTNTARSILNRFEQAGLVREHGDISLDVGNVRLFRPVNDDPEVIMRKLEQLNSSSTVGNGDRKPVVPGDFTHLGEGQYQLNDDPSVVIDVSKPPSGSIKDSVREQFENYGLTPSSDYSNINYFLRKRAGLLD